jgi:hypothetical protein
LAWVVAIGELHPPLSALDPGNACDPPGIARIGEDHPPLAEHGDRAVRTGTYYAYAPDPAAPAAWTS